MCGTCGCGHTENHHEHDHAHEHHQHGHDTEKRRISVELDLLDRNRTFAAENRAWFDKHRIFVLNVVSSPGSGKTTLLAAMIRAQADKYEVSVIEGDQQTTLDAERIAEAGARVHQINTGNMCHLDAHMVGHALEHLQPTDDSVLVIENVGNLICPAAFDLGEHLRVALISVTEGEEKPLKYPDMFAGSQAVIINKCDLLPHLNFDMAQCRDNIHRINPDAAIFELSATSGEGVCDWLQWLASARAKQHKGKQVQGAA